MNNSKHTVIEVDTNLVEIEKGFNPRRCNLEDCVGDGNKNLSNR